MAQNGSLCPRLRQMLRTSGQTCSSALSLRRSPQAHRSLLDAQLCQNFAIGRAPISTSASLCKRKTRDNNRLRGLSSIRRSGPRDLLSVMESRPHDRRYDGYDEVLPQPVDAKHLPKVETDPNHGLWGFFHDKEHPINTPEQDQQFGRAWTIEELRRKSWEDLHRLWWVCVKERNRIATSNWEREHRKYGYGEVESGEREEEVRKTQRSIKFVLTERYYAWEDAYKLARDDPEVQLSNEEAPYTPAEYLEDDLDYVEMLDAASQQEGKGKTIDLATGLPQDRQEQSRPNA